MVDVHGGRVTLDGQTLDAHLEGIEGTPLHHVLLGTASWTVAAESLDASHWVLGAMGERRDVMVMDERSRQIQELTGKKGPAAGGGVIRAPMPGLVVRVEVAVGDRVAAGAGLVVVEAMKMENELRAPGAAVVTAVHVSPGAAVEKGATLVTLELTGP